MSFGCTLIGREPSKGLPDHFRYTFRCAREDRTSFMVVILAQDDDEAWQLAEIESEELSAHAGLSGVSQDSEYSESSEQKESSEGSEDSESTENSEDTEDSEGTEDSESSEDSEASEESEASEDAEHKGDEGSVIIHAAERNVLHDEWRRLLPKKSTRKTANRRKR